MAYVVDSDGPALFGRDWLQNIVFDWRSLHIIKANATAAPSGGLRCVPHTLGGVCQNSTKRQNQSYFSTVLDKIP